MTIQVIGLTSNWINWFNWSNWLFVSNWGIYVRH